MIVRFLKQLAPEIIKGRFSALKNFRYYGPWKSSQESNSMVDRKPCLTYEAMDIINNYITPKARVFEYGGGGSTLYFTDRAAEVVTVEHNPNWWDKITQAVTASKWTGKLLQPTREKNEKDPSDPANYSSAEKFGTYREYASYIDNYGDEYFDIVMVDGRSRPSCIKHSLPKLKTGGLLIVDDVYRDYYLPHFKEILEKNFQQLCFLPGPVPYYNFFGQTGVWKKLKN
ncbi:MAG: hypothetical protein H7Y27_16020 [Gemmatimonadaceae bacterium]|nr:hypothetical protein [Chitinophagaceae bacterium]